MAHGGCFIAFFGVNVQMESGLDALMLEADVTYCCFNA